MRVAFTLIGGTGWTGGTNYLENLLSALSELPGRPVSAVLFAGKDADQQAIDRLVPYLSEPPVLSSIWDRRARIRLLRLVCGFLFQRDYFAEREFRRANIDLVFQHQAWYGCLFKVPTLAWIADFQHRRLPAMFSKIRFLWRDVGYGALSRCASRLMVSSEDAKRDCEAYYPRSRGRISVLPFVVKASSRNDCDPSDIRELYDLPEKFFYLPNQLWKHKNHLGVIEALRLIKQKKGELVIVASGNAHDVRHPKYPQYLLSLVQIYGLEDNFRYLGFIPSKHILPLMRLSIAVVNPSFCEGWSTTVEEAKAIGAPLLLSNLPIHREQTGGAAIYFDPSSPAGIARALDECWGRFSTGPRADAESKASQINRIQRKIFARDFVEICKTVLD
jgi:glycosyltransferase involved in cell wall biosynthesis